MNENKYSNQLEKFGFDDFFKNASKQLINDGFEVTRIIEVNKNNYKISNGSDEIFAELSGKFMYNADSGLDFPTVGDWVAAQCFDDNSLAIIHDILPRRSLLKRKDPGKTIDFQLIGANIDYAFLVQSADANFNLNRLERYLVMVQESGIKPIIVLSKTDLVNSDELAEMEESIKRLNGKYPLLPISNETSDGIKTLENELIPGKTYCLLGSSGVGKTTLLNMLIGDNVFRANAVREKDSKGRHTTSRRQLTLLESGSIIVDTPGMRELGNFGIETGLQETFDDIVSYFSKCKFSDCKHQQEIGCAVLEAVENGEIDQARYKNYLQIQKESAHYEMSYVEKRHKDKAFHKMIKGVMASKKNKR